VGDGQIRRARGNGLDNWGKGNTTSGGVLKGRDHQEGTRKFRGTESSKKNVQQQGTIRKGGGKGPSVE